MDPSPQPDLGSGQSLPLIRKGEATKTRAVMERARRRKAPMGPKEAGMAPPLVFAKAYGVNVWDPDGNRYVDFCAGFGSVLLGHRHLALQHEVEAASANLEQAMGDVFDSEAKIALLERLSELMPEAELQGILGLSGADAVTAAIKTSVLATGRHRLVAFEGSYHGLSYAPLSVSGLRASYRTPFQQQLNPHVDVLPFPEDAQTLDALERTLRSGEHAAVIVEPILGRGGVRVLPRAALERLLLLARASGALLIADEIWTGLGRSGAWLWSVTNGVTPDLVCLGKGLGGAMPVSVCLGSRELMRCWSQDREVVHTSTHAGSPLGCASALATIELLDRLGLVERSARLGRELKLALESKLAALGVGVRGEGLMLGIDFGSSPGVAARVMAGLLAKGFITSTGGGTRDTLVVTPPLIVSEELLGAFVDAAGEVIQDSLG